MVILVFWAPRTGPYPNAEQNSMDTTACQEQTLLRRYVTLLESAPGEDACLEIGMNCNPRATLERTMKIQEVIL
jgi:hypothetical protein